MTQEKKQLLLKDLCARLPYGVKISLDKKHIEESSFIGTYCDDIVLLSLNGESMNLLTHIEKYGVKPYLRPISSMTEDEKVEYRKTQDKISVQWDDYGQSIGYVYANTINTYDWLNAHYFDYRGLIKNGLALEAPKGLYKIE